MSISAITPIWACAGIEPGLEIKRGVSVGGEMPFAELGLIAVEVGFPGACEMRPLRAHVK